MNDSASRQSSERLYISTFENAVDWHVTKQKMITTSTTEAKLLALTHAAKKIY
jgi:hypothetical protein